MQIKIKPEGTGRPATPVSAVREPSLAMLNSIDGCLKRDQMAPSFEAEAYHKGKRVMVNSRDFANKWLVMFFYSSDFTFV